MNLFPAWRDSLTLFQPKNFKLFFLVTLKTMGDTFKVWIKYFWWLPLIQLVMPRIWLSLYGTTSFFSNPWLQVTASIFMGMLWFISILLAARPSVAIKNCAYFRSYIWRIIYILPISVLLDVGTEFLMSTVFYSYIGVPREITPGIVTAIILAGIMSWSVKIYLIDYALFVLDTDGSVKQVCKSLFYAFKMVAYNYPFYIVVYIIDTSIKMAQYLLFRQITKWYYSAATGMASVSPEPDSIGLQVIRYGDILIIALLMLFLYCFLINFYIKKLHDQFTLYFGKNE